MSNLERSPTPPLSHGSRPAAAPVRERITAREVDLGEGIAVRRLLPKRQRTTVGAWCFVDHFGPLDLGDGPGMRVPPHPHIGLQTVTWLVEGEVLHRDSFGSLQTIRPGQLNLMTAGHGIAHSEESPPGRPPVLHGVQLWAALPSRSRTVDPAFHHVGELPVLTTPGGLRVTLLVGEAFGAVSPAPAHSPLLGADVELPGATQELLPLRPAHEHGVVALGGDVFVDGVGLRPGSMLYLGTGRESLELRGAGPARLLLLGGEPFGEPLFMWWNFVAHSAEEIATARADWAAARRFGEVHGFDGPRLDAPPLGPGRLRPRG